MSLHPVDQVTKAFELLHVAPPVSINNRPAVTNTLEHTAKGNIDHLLGKESAIGNVISIIRSNMPPGKMQIVGDELYRLLGFEFCAKKLREAGHQEEVNPEFQHDCSMPFEAITFRFELKGADDAGLVSQIRDKVGKNIGFQSVSKPHLISDKKTSFYLFTFFNQGQKIHCVFYKNLQSQFVATADALQVVVHENGEYSIQDHGYSDAWAKDTYMKVYHVINGEGSNILQQLFRAVDRGFSLTQTEYEIFKKRCQMPHAENTLYALWNSAINEVGSLRNIFHICNLCHGAKMADELEAFLNKVVPEHVSRYGKLEGKSDFGSVSLAMITSGMLTYREWQELSQFFGLFNGSQSALDIRLPMHTFMRLIPALHRQPLFERFLKHFDPLPEGKGKSSQVTGSLQAASIVRYELAKEGHDLRVLYLPCLLLAGILRQDDFVRFALSRLPQAAKSCGDAMHHLIGQGMRRIFEGYALVLPEHLQNGGLSSEQIEREWIGFLLCQPHVAFQQAGIAYLLASDHYPDLQLKICPILAQTNPQQLASQITKLQAEITDAQVIGWITCSTHKSLLVSELLRANTSRWLALCLASFSDEVVSFYQTSKSETVLAALTKAPPSKHSRRIVTWWAHESTLSSVDSGLRAHLDEVVKLDGWTEDAKLCVKLLINDASSQDELAELLFSYSSQVDNFAQYASKLTDEQVISWLKSSSSRSTVIADLLRVNAPRWGVRFIHHFPDELFKAFPHLIDAHLQTALEHEQIPFTVILHLAAKIAQNISIFQTLKISATTVLRHLSQHRHHAAVWDSAFVTCFKACTAELTDKQYRRYAFDLLQLMLHPQAAVHDINFVAQVLVVLAARELDQASYSMPKGYQTLSTALEASGLHLALLSLLRLQQVASSRPLSKEDGEAVIHSLRQVDELPVALMRWYLALELPYKMSPLDQVRNMLAACQSHPGLIAEKSKKDLAELHKRVEQSADYSSLQDEIAASMPEAFSSHFEPYAKKTKEKTQAAIQREVPPKRDPVVFAKELLTKESACLSDVTRAIDSLLGQVNPDPQRQVIDLLFRNSMYAVGQWRRAFSRFFEKEMYGHLLHGINTFQTIKGDATRDFRKALWQELFKHVDWLEKSDAVNVFKELPLLESELGLTLDHETLIRVLTCLARALEKNTLLHSEYLPIALNLMLKVPTSHKERSSLGWKLLSFCSGNLPPDLLVKASNLLVSILPSLHTGVNLVPYLQATCLAQHCKASTEPLQQLIKQASALQNFELNATLVRQLASHPELTLKEALTDVLIFLLKEICKEGFIHAYSEEIAKAVENLKNVLVRNGGVDCLQKIYDYIIRREEKLPSTIRRSWNKAIATFDPEVPNPPAQNGLLPFAVSYARYLVESLASNDPQKIRNALDIDLSLSLYNKKNAPLVRGYFESYNKVAMLLFLRQLEHFGWDQVSQNFFRHMAHRAIAPQVLSYLHNPQKDDLSLVHKEHYKVSIVDANRDGFYQFGNASITMRVIPVLSTSRQTPLMSETSYQVFVQDLVDTCLERVRTLPDTSEVRSRLLDLALSNLSVLCELYPQNPEISKLFRAFCFALSPHDALWDTHASIFHSLYRLAILHGALDANSPIFDECVKYLPAPHEEVRKQNTAIVNDVAKVAGEMLVGKTAFSVSRLIEQQMALAKWRDTSFAGNFEPLLDCIKRLASIWVMHPEVLDSPKVIQTMEYLLIPRRRFFGVGLAEKGEAFAYQAATELLNRLMFLYQALQKTVSKDSIKVMKQKGQELEILLSAEGKRYLDCLNWIMRCSKTFLRAQVYNAHYADWRSQSIKLFDLILHEANKPFIPQMGEPLITFTMTLCQAVPEKENYKARIELVDMWMKRAFAYTGPYDQHVKGNVITGLQQAKIVRDIQEAELPILLRWMHMLGEVFRYIPIEVMVAFVVQLRNNKWTSKESESGKAFWKKMPGNIQLF